MNIFDVTLLILVFVGLIKGVRSHFECHAKEPDTDKAIFYQSLIRQYQAATARRRLSGERDTVVPTYYHLIEEDGLPVVSDETVMEQHTVLNESFFGTGFSFEFMGTTRTSVPASEGPFPGDAWFEDEEVLRASLHVGDFDTLNIFVPTLPFFFGGYASLPTILLLDSAEQDGVVINADFLPGGPGGPSGENDLGRVLVHEVGHWFDLYHTFQGGCDGQFGDFIADTPAMTTELAFTCPEEPLDTCPSDPGTDPRGNFMAYSTDECYQEFTAGQIVRMEAAWELFRTGSKNAACTKLCKLMIPEYFPNLGQCQTSMCTKGNVKGDTCAKATKVKLGKTYTGSTVFADVDSEAPTCNDIEPLSGGVWYEVKGNGGLFQASTCGFTSLLLNSQVSVYEGGCTELSCVTANSDGEGCTDGRGEALFLTETGTTYSILVHGFARVSGDNIFTTEGAFEFVVNEIPRKECFFPTFFPGCEDLSCEASVCASNPFCCDVGWDYTCVVDACDLCEASSGTAALCEDCPRSELGISIETDFFPAETTWEVVSLTKDNAIVAKGGPYSERLFVYEETVENLCTSDCYEFLIFDSFGDGLSVGPGTYNITWLGETIPSPSDGFYEFFETIIFGNCP